MAFVRTIVPEAADGAVAEMYEQARKRLGHVPNWMQAFSLRPGVRDGWVGLMRSIQGNMPSRRYNLATLAAARALRSSYCALAHGSALAGQDVDAPTLAAAMKDLDAASALTPAERAMMRFVEKVVLAADAMTAADIETLRTHGYGDDEIFDIAATAAARCFFSKLLDALGVQADARFHGLDAELKEVLTVGRPIEGADT